jgi:hypothetical protein
MAISDHPLDLTTHGFDLGIRFGTLPDVAFHARKIASNRPARVRSLIDFLVERFKHIDHLDEHESTLD